MAAAEQRQAAEAAQAARMAAEQELAKLRAEQSAATVQLHGRSDCFCEVDVLGRLEHTFLLFLPSTAPWSGLDPSQRLQNGPGMLLDQVSAKTVDSGPDSGHFR